MLEILLCISDRDVMTKCEEALNHCIENENLKAKIGMAAAYPWDMVKYLEENDGSYWIAMDFFYPNGDRGADYAKQIRAMHRDAYIVFVSNSYKNMQVAFEGLIRPCGFFKVPLDMDGFVEVFQKSYEDNKIHGKLKRYYLLKFGNLYQRIEQDRILYVEATEKKVHINTINQRIIQVDTLENVGLKLAEEQFIRCHKAFIVNADCIVQYDYTAMEITLSNEAIVPFTRKYKEVIKAVMEQKSCHSSLKSCILSESIE